ncbi:MULTISPECIES: GDSL-type esterase/lipase family protein [Paenibacillus]|uniref:Lysophospholipase n=1 Tax=Paenibacillus campinasensis TaxID=66347 RepID=A0A268ERK5_9BACL|nr:GDSL-type esterase/lipase family protein [Paenibacillus campinasensis]MUG66243.1 lysophospholipase [Paenibacillus campinasensis]PAD75748.1 lysophospholipase [Paenibacillus campinasensis]
MLLPSGTGVKFVVYHYTAVGDSLTFGFGAMPGSGFVSLYRRMAEVKLKRFVAHENLGINGLTAKELNERLMQAAAFRYHLQQAQIITLSIGGNDLIRAVKSSGGRPTREVLDAALYRCQHHVAEIIGKIQRLKSAEGKPYYMRVIGLYNPYPAWSEAVEYVVRFNRFLFAMEHDYFRVADVYSLFAGRERELLSIDGIHPNGSGYRVIALQLDRLGYKPFG